MRTFLLRQESTNLTAENEHAVTATTTILSSILLIPFALYLIYDEVK